MVVFMRWLETEVVLQSLSMLEMPYTLLDMSYTRLQPVKTVVDQVQPHNKQFENGWRMLVLCVGSTV